MDRARIIDGRCTGKTEKLLKIAEERHAAVVCANPYAMQYKSQQYGTNVTHFYSYNGFMESDNSTENFVIDELENFITAVTRNPHFVGYTISEED